MASAIAIPLPLCFSCFVPVRRFRENLTKLFYFYLSRTYDSPGDTPSVISLALNYYALADLMLYRLSVNIKHITLFTDVLAVTPHISTLRYECDETFYDECEFAARAEGESCNHTCQENVFRTSIVRNFISRGVK